MVWKLQLVVIFSAGVFEEEDFQPALYGYGVCAEVSEVRAGGMMREVEEELQRAVKATRNRQGEPWDPKMQKQVRYWKCPEL